MNQEREMILKMLKDGKVTVEEAEALLQVLEESEPEEATGSPIEVKSTSSRHDGPHGGFHRREERTEDQGFRFDFDRNFDFSFIGDTVRKTLAGVKDTIREAMEGIREVDLESEIKRAFGKERGFAEIDIEASSDGITTVKLGNGSGETGDVTVGASDDSTVRVHARVTGWANDVATAEERAKSVALQTTVEGGNLLLSADTGGEPGIRRVRVDYQILVPGGVSVGIDTIGGDVEVNDVSADVWISTISGDISIAHVTGDVEAKTKSGDVEANGIGGDLKCASLSGDIAVSGARGDIACDTKSGDVEVSGALAAVSAQSVSGDVAVRMDAAPSTAVDLKSVSGDLELSVVAETSARIELRTTSGEIDCEAPVREERRSRTELTGVMNDGLAEIRMSTVSGDIELS